MKFILSFLLVVNILFAEENNTVKTSELELFLFKIGFESLLKDVEITKDKSTLNEEELKKLNEKVELIMNEIYKDKRVLKVENSSVQTPINYDEIIKLKEEIALLKEEMKSFKKQVNVKKEISKEAEIQQTSEVEYPINKKIKITLVNQDNVKVRAKEAFLRDAPEPKSGVVKKIFKGDLVDIDYCDKFFWCKLKNSNTYIPVYSLDLSFNH